MEYNFYSYLIIGSNTAYECDEALGI